MNSTVENRIKRGAEELMYHGTKKMRLINHAYENLQPVRGTKRRNREESEEPSEELIKRSKVTPHVKGVKRKGDMIMMNPTKRVKTMHRTWRRNIQGCRPAHDADHDNDKDGNNHSLWIAIVA
jgi:hypothetical protein